MGLKFALNFKICNAYITKAGITDSGMQWSRESMCTQETGVLSSGPSSATTLMLWS